jgi:hypothetical protein
MVNLDWSFLAGRALVTTIAGRPEDDDVLVGDQVERQPLLTLLADEVALEERAADDEVGAGDPRQ